MLLLQEALEVLHGLLVVLAHLLYFAAVCLLRLVQLQSGQASASGTGTRRQDSRPSFVKKKGVEC